MRRQQRVCSAADGVALRVCSVGRRLSTASVTFDVSREAHRVRVEGQANCLVTRPWDPCGGVNGWWAVAYAPPPSPPPPSPPSPPPSPPHSPPPTPPPHAPLAFSVVATATFNTSELAANTVPRNLTQALSASLLATLSAAERDCAASTIWIGVIGRFEVTSSTTAELVRSAAEGAA